MRKKDKIIGDFDQSRMRVKKTKWGGITTEEYSLELDLLKPFLEVLIDIRDELNDFKRSQFPK